MGVTKETSPNDWHDIRKIDLMLWWLNIGRSFDIDWKELLISLPNIRLYVEGGARVDRPGPSLFNQISTIASTMSPPRMVRPCR
jgi:hypothetical protein